MKRLFLWLIPTMSLVCSLIINDILEMNEIFIATIDFILFFVYTYGILLVAPCFYVFMINSVKHNKQKFIGSIICAGICIITDALIFSPKSILYYLNIKKPPSHYVDFFSMYIIVPAIIVFVGVGIILLLKKIKNKRKKEG